MKAFNNCVVADGCFVFDGYLLIKFENIKFSETPEKKGYEGFKKGIKPLFEYIEKAKEIGIEEIPENLAYIPKGIKYTPLRVTRLEKMIKIECIIKKEKAFIITLLKTKEEVKKDIEMDKQIEKEKKEKEKEQKKIERQKEKEQMDNLKRARKK